MIRVHVAAEKSISSAMEDKNVGKKLELHWISWWGYEEVFGEEIEMKYILRNRDFFTFETQNRGIIFYNMQVDYSKLWARYKEMGHKNKTDLIEMAGISTNILAKLTKGEFISMDSIQRICKALNCDVGDICVINKVED